MTRSGEPVSVVLLHGYDSTPSAMMPVADAIAKRFSRVSIEIPAGPIPVQPATGAWFDGERAAEAANLFAARLHGPAVLIGFSQGAALGLTVAAVTAAEVRGVASLSGFLPDDVTVAPQCALFVGHGEDDEVVDAFHARRLIRLATAVGTPVQQSFADYGHTLPSALEPLLAWLGGILKQ